jgi:hypothetical protein
VVNVGYDGYIPDFHKNKETFRSTILQYHNSLLLATR